MKNHHKNALICSLISCGIVLAIDCAYTYICKFKKQIKINKKYTIVENGNTSYMISTHDNEIYKINDNVWFWSYGKAEKWNAIEIDKVYTIYGTSTRSKFFDTYPIISHFEKI
jgi:hypothetical protein